MRPLVLVIGLALCALIAWAWLSIDPQRYASSKNSVGAPAVATTMTRAGATARELDAVLPPTPPRSYAEQTRTEAAGEAPPVAEAQPKATMREFQVVDGRTGEPIGALVLRAHADPFTVEVTTDAGGGFDLPQPELSNGLVTLEVVESDPSQPVSRLLDPSMVDPGRLRRGFGGARIVRAFARAPAIEVEVRDGRGVRLPGATAWLHEAEALDGAPRSRALAAGPPIRAHTDANGLARFSTFEAEPDVASIAFVDDENGAVSAPIVVQHSARSALPVLRIEPAGTIRVRILDALGRPLPDFEVKAALVVEPYAPLPLWTENAARGVVASRPLPPGAYRVRVRHASGAPELVTDVEVRSATETPVEFSFAGDLPERAISGVVRDENGAPLANIRFAVLPRDGSSSWNVTRFDGTFEAWRMRCARVTLTVGVDGMSDAFEPAFLETDFGSENIVVRRSAVVPRSRVLIRPVDALTGAVLLDARLLLIREETDLVVAAFPVGDRWRRQPSGGEALPTDLIFVDAKFLPSMRWRLLAPGHEIGEGRVAEWAASQNAAAAIEIALKPGFEASVRVTDRQTREPLDGVRCLDARDFAVVAYSDERGVVALRGIEPPSGGFLLEHPGYYTGSWDPLTRWSENGAIELWPRAQ